MKAYFITGTDTDVGKTIAAVSLLYTLQESGLKMTAMKPVAAGCVPQTAPNPSLVNVDALQLKALLPANIPYAYVNPKAYAPPIAPHIAAAQANDPIRVAELVAAYKSYQVDFPADAMVIEGAGGWQLPLSESESMPEFVQAINAEVILVIGLKLGCLNHALLTVKAIEAAGLRVAGWIGNRTQAKAMAYEAENIEYLHAAISAPCLGLLPYLEAVPEPQSDRLSDRDLLSPAQLKYLSGYLRLDTLL